MTDDARSRKPFYWSLGLHILVLGFLILEVSFSTQPAVKPSGSVIQATVVNSRVLQQYQEKIQQKALAKQQAILKAQELQQQALLQQQELLQAQQAAAAAKIAAQKAAAQKAIQQAKQHAIKQSIEKELQQSMQKQLAKPVLAAKPSAAPTKSNKPVASTQNTGLADKYKALIIQAISEQWIVPANLPKNISCVLDVRVAPGGVVLSVTVATSSGNPILDSSAVAAVNKASPLPVPADPNLFNQFRELHLTVKPDGEIDA